MNVVKRICVTLAAFAVGSILLPAMPFALAAWAWSEYDGEDR